MTKTIFPDAQGHTIPCCPKKIPSHAIQRESYPMPPQGHAIPCCPKEILSYTAQREFHPMLPQGHPMLVHPMGIPFHATTRTSHPSLPQGHSIPCRHKGSCHPNGIPSHTAMQGHPIPVRPKGLPSHVGRTGKGFSWGRLGWDVLVAAWNRIPLGQTGMGCPCGGMEWNALGADWDGMCHRCYVMGLLADGWVEGIGVAMNMDRTSMEPSIEQFMLPMSYHVCQCTWQHLIA